MGEKLTPAELSELTSADAGMIGLLIAKRYRDRRINGAVGLYLAQDIRDVILALRPAASPSNPEPSNDTDPKALEAAWDAILARYPKQDYPTVDGEITIDRDDLSVGIAAALAALPQAEPVAASPVAFVTPETMKDILAQSLWTQGAVGEFRCDNRHGFTVPLYAEPPFASPTPAVSRPSREWMREKIAGDPDMETEVRPALAQPHSEK